MMYKFLAVAFVGACAAFQAPFVAPHGSSEVARSASPQMGASIRELRDRVGSVKNTKKITSAMKLVAAAKVRRAQEAVLRSRPFSETLERIPGDRGLCGSYNAAAIKKTEARIAELKEQGIDC